MLNDDGVRGREGGRDTHRRNTFKTNGKNCIRVGNKQGGGGGVVLREKGLRGHVIISH